MGIRLFFLILFSLIFVNPLQAAELAGVKMPDEVNVSGKMLKLNGLGLRKKGLLVDVYVAGLYLPQKTTGASKILGADQDRYMVMHFMRPVDKAKICNAWDEGLIKNTSNPSQQLKDQFKTLCSYMEDVNSGDQYTFNYVPGRGTEIKVKGQTKGNIAGKEFANALWRCWIGPNPPGQSFKTGLVGK